MCTLWYEKEQETRPQSTPSKNILTPFQAAVNFSRIPSYTPALLFSALYNSGKALAARRFSSNPYLLQLLTQLHRDKICVYAQLRLHNITTDESISMN